MSLETEKTETLLARAHSGSSSAVEELLQTHRQRVRNLIASRMADWMKSKVDASDLVQDTLTEASLKIEDYAASRPVPFFPWLRAIGLQRLAKLRTYHLAQKRNVLRETSTVASWNTSAQSPAAQLAAQSPTPSSLALGNERTDRLNDLVATLPATDRDLLTLRYLEQVPVEDCLVVLGISREAYKKRHFRAIRRLRDLMNESEWK